MVKSNMFKVERGTRPRREVTDDTDLRNGFIVLVKCCCSFQLVVEVYQVLTMLATAGF